MSDTLTRDRAGVVDMGQFKHERVKVAAAEALSARQAKAIANARRLADRADAYASLLEAGHLYFSPAAIGAELPLATAAASVAGQDTFVEWIDFCEEHR